MKTNCKKVVKLFLIFCLTFSLNSFAYPSAEPPISISGKLSKSTVVGMHLEEVVIEVSGTKNMTVKPDRFGNYMVRNLPRGGTYTIKPIDKGLSFSPASRTYRGLTESKINEDYIPSEKTFSISGRVLSGGKPVKGLTVMISHRNNKYFTDQDGYYSIDHLEYNGPYTVSVVADNYAFEPFTVDFLDKDIIHDFSKDIVLSGQVTSFDKPVKNIEIDINGIKYKTDENGNYSVKGSFAGIDCKITLSNEALIANPAYISLTKISNDKENLNFDISAEISGKITYNNAPFKDAIVKIEELNKTHKTDAKGEFDFSNLSLDQEYTVSVSSAGYMFEPSEWKIKNLATEKNKKEFVANVKKYKAVVTAKKGESPIAGATVTLLETKKTFVTDAQGKCVIPALKFGSKYNVSIKKEGVSFMEAKKQIENNNDKNMELNVPFDVALTISGTVRKDLKPIANAIVVCGDQKVKSNIKGKYTLKGLKSNTDYTVSVSSGSLVFDENPITIENLTDSKNNVDFVIDTKKKEQEKKLQLAKEAELKAQEEAKKKAEEERLAKEAEEARLKAEKEEQERLAKEAELKAQEEAKQKEEELRLAKEAEEAKIKAEKEEADRIAKEAELKAQEEAKQKEEELKLAKEAEEARIKAEKEEADRIAKEAELKAQEEAKQKAEEERLAKEAEAARIKAEKEEQARIAKEEKLKAQEEAKKKAEEARLAKEAEKARLKAEKEEQARLAKEAKLKAQEEAKKKAEEAKLAKEAEKARLKAEKDEMTKLAKNEAKKKALEKEEKAKSAKESKVKLQEEIGITVENENLNKEAEIARIKAEKEAAEKAAKEAELKAKEAQEDVNQKIEEARLAKEAEEARIKAEKEAAEKAAKEAELKAKEEAKQLAEEERLAKAAEEARIKAEKEEADRIAKEAELKAQEEAKLKAEEERLAKEAEEARLKAEKEEAERIAKEAELKAQEEAKLKAEEERLAKEAEEARLKAEKEEADRIAKEAELKAQEEAKKKAEEERLAKEAEKARLKAEKEEQARIAKEEKLKAQEEAKKKAEEARLAKEAEKTRLKAEKEEQIRLAKEAKLKAQEEARLAKEAEDARIKTEKEEADRIAKEAELNAQEEAKKKAEEERLAKEAEEKKLKEKEKLSIKGRILKGKDGVSGVQVRVLTEEEEKIYLTDKNGFYKISNLVKGENYTVTVISGKTTLELSPKVRVYKKFSKSLTNQNFYVVENYNVTPDAAKKAEKSVSKGSDQNGKDSSYEWNKNYGIQNKDGVIQKDIQW